MAYVYRKRDLEDGDVPVPEMWNHNMDAYSSEMNGFLDRDNLPRNSIGASQTNYDVSGKGAASTATYVSFKTYAPGSAFAVQTDTKGWQQIPISFDSIQTPVEEVAEVEASIAIDPTWNDSGGSHVAPVDSNNSFVQFQIVIGGVVACETGEVSVAYAQINASMCGIAPIVAGSSAVDLYVRYGKNNDGAVDPSDLEIPRLAVCVTRHKR